MLSGLLLVLSTACAGYDHNIRNSSDPNYDPRVEFAECLVENGLSVYYADHCQPCDVFKKAMGPRAWPIIQANSTYCGNYLMIILGRQKTEEECTNNDVEGYPSFVIKGEKITGLLTIEQLEEYTGCRFDG